jgi:hypothetical protein
LRVNNFVWIIKFKFIGGSSSGLELKGIHEGIEDVLKLGAQISTLTTDRNKSVTTLMKSYPHIEHKYDSWHIIKGIRNAWRTVNWSPIIF